MPICEIDPWRTQYFENAACPADVFIPTEDSDGWLWNPKHRWIYDKLAVAVSQGLNAAPHGIAPQNYPVFSKPIYNLKGMGVGSRPLASADDYADAYQPGHMWSTLLEGKHISSDVALIDGAPQWWRHAGGIASGGGTIVATASMAGLVPAPFDPIYAANKHAVVGLVRSIGDSYAAEGVRVHALCPSFAYTNIIKGSEQTLLDMGFPIIEVADVVDAFERILDSDSTGQCWYVVAGRPSEPFEFRRAPGPRID